MKKFIKNILLFLLIGLLIGEIISRMMYLSSDIPQREIDDSGIQKYIPNQTGHWKGGTHTWNVNELGWTGTLPDKYDNLISIIGDSFIENFMNPNECHQSIYLKKNLPEYNFIETARSGVSFIEAMEIAKQVEKKNPIYQLIYVNDSDFIESVEDIEQRIDITQLNIEKNTIRFGVLKSPGSKKILYNWKFIYYLYNRFNLGNINLSSIKPKEQASLKQKNENDVNSNLNKIDKLVTYAKLNYKIENLVLVFHPNTNIKIIEILEKQGFKVISLSTQGEEKTWTFDYDKHWTCYGHKRVAEQIANKISENLNTN